MKSHESENELNKTKIDTNTITLVLLSLTMAWVDTWMLASAAQPKKNHLPAFPEISDSRWFNPTMISTLLCFYGLSSAYNIYVHLNEVADHALPDLIGHKSHSHSHNHSHSHSHSHGDGQSDNKKKDSTTAKSGHYKFFICALTSIPVVFATIADYYQFDSLDSEEIAIGYFVLKAAYNIFVEGLHMYCHGVESDFVATPGDEKEQKKSIIFNRFNAIVTVEFVAHIATAALFADRSPKGIQIAAVIAGALAEAITHADDINQFTHKIKEDCSHLEFNCKSARKLAVVCVIAPINGLAMALPPMLMLEIQMHNGKQDNSWLATLAAMGIAGEFINGYANASIRIGKFITGLDKKQRSGMDQNTPLIAEKAAADKNYTSVAITDYESTGSDKENKEETTGCQSNSFIT